jgi:uncharacterized membrane protein
MAYESIIGIALALISTIMFNLAPILMKESLDKMTEVKMSNMIKSILMMFRNKKYVIGWLMSVLGGLPYVIALQLAGITTVQPILNFGFIVLVILAYRRLKEKLSTSAIIAIILMIIMPLFIALGNVSNSTVNFVLWNSQLNFIIFVIICSGLIIVQFILTKKIPILYAGVIGIMFSLGALSLQSFLAVIDSAGYDLVSDIGILVPSLLSDPNLIFARVSIALCIIFNALAGYVVNIGLQKNPASKITPIHQTVNNCSAFICGVLVFGQVVNNWVFYIIGFVMGIIGVMILGQYQLPSANTSKNVTNSTVSEVST